ncbi:cytochrome c peroxidase [Nannocystis exedens]|uniref:Cytochrome c peroxidase n=2 Tax=Nannocystis exedens TaxID=54 RepID=A0A1I1Y7V6_9BACT|nr:di-heme cytochrome c peroxidase [Nannocystis exedens]SFE13950.1 cytochrome c peroxidase [Nannocystis exedens]
MLKHRVVAVLGVSMVTAFACDVEGVDEPVGAEADVTLDDVDEPRGGLTPSALLKKLLVAEVRDLIEESGIEPLEPPPPVSDELFELGEALFYDKILSGNRDVSCSTCHHPRLATTDRLTMNRGVYGVGIGPERVGAAVGGRTTQPLWNLHKLQKGLAVDHKVPLLGDGYVYPLGAPFIPFEWQDDAFDPDMKAAAGQAMMPEVTDQEMLGFPGDNDFTTECPQDDPPFGLMLCAWGKMMERLGEIPEYVDMFEAAYPGVAFEDMHFAYAGNAIAAYEFRAFFSNDTPWDRFVGRFDPVTGGLVPGDDDALTLQQLAGARRFLDPDLGNCTSCHAGNAFTDEDFHKTLQPQFGPGDTVPGGDGPGGLDDFGRMRLSGDPADKYAWRTPPLRNVMLTGPWGRQSHYNDIKDFLRHYRFPVMALLGYDITESVDEVAMHSQFLENRQAIIAEGVDPLLYTVDIGGPLALDNLVQFLHALSDDNGADFSHLIPASVPSGLPVDP